MTADASTVSQTELLGLFRDAGALLDGHFLLTSGLHSPHYFQCAKVLQYPAATERLGRALADGFRDERIDVVIAPAVGGIVVGQEVGRQLGARTMFAERQDGRMTLRRGFALAPGERVLVCEDVVTTGGSVVEVIDLVRSAGADPVGVAFVVDRSNGAVRFPVARQVALLQLAVVTYDPSSCPLCASGSVAVKPGSRGLS